MQRSPFKFLDSYTKEDKHIFFGREHETDELFRKVFESKIMLVYGISGTGKSSLLNCGLANRIPDTDWLPLNIRRGSNIAESMAYALRQAAVTPLPKTIETPTQFIKAAKSVYLDHYKPLFFMFDQFEELFIFGSHHEKQEFAQIVQALTEAELQCRFIFVMREEYLAGATEFEQTIPSFMANRVRIEKMTQANALQAIEGPCKAFGIKLDDGFADKLLEKLNPGSSGVELTYLQVYLDKLYRLTKDENHPDGLHFKNELLTKTGNVSDLLGSFLDEQIKLLSDPETALAVLKSFVSVKGTKRQMSESEVTEYAKTIGKPIKSGNLQTLIQTLIQLRILRDKDQNNRYELRHDALAIKIYEKITLVEKELLEISHLIDNAWHNYEKRGLLISKEDLDYIAPYESRLHLPVKLRTLIDKSKRQLLKAKRRKVTIAFAAMLALLVVFAGFTMWALGEKRKAERSDTRFEAHLLNTMANDLIHTDPTKALRLAEHAYSLYPSENIANSINRIYLNNVFYKTVIQSELAIRHFIVSPNRQSFFVGYQNGLVSKYDAEGKHVKDFLGHNRPITTLDIDPVSENLLSCASNGTMIIWNSDGVMINRQPGRNFRAYYSPDGNYIASGDYQNGEISTFDRLGNRIIRMNVAGLTSYSFLPNSSSIIAASRDGNVLILGVEGQETQRIELNHRIDNILAIPNGNNFMVTADNIIRIYDKDWELKDVYALYSSNISSIKLSEDGKFFITTSHTDRTAILWHITGVSIAVIKNQGNIQSALIMPGNKKVFTAISNAINASEISGKLTNINNMDYESVFYDLVYADSGEQFMGFFERKAIVFNKEGETITRIANVIDEGIDDKTNFRATGCFSASGDHVLLSFSSKLAGLFDLQGNLLKIFEGHDDMINVISHSPGGKFFVSGANDHKAIVWDADGNIINILKHDDPVTSVRVAHNNEFILTGTDKGRIFLWDVNGELTREFPKGHDSKITELLISRDDQTIHSFSGYSFEKFEYTLYGQDYTAFLKKEGDNYLKTWDIHGKLINEAVFDRELSASFAFHPDLKNVLIGYTNQTAELTDLSGENIKHFYGHHSEVIAGAISPDGQTIVTADLGAVYVRDRKISYEAFHEAGNYEKLSYEDLLHYGIIQFDDALDILEGNELFAAAGYYLEASEGLEHENRVVYLQNSLAMLRKLNKSQTNVDYLLKQFEVIEQLKLIAFQRRLAREAERLHAKLLSYNDSQVLRQAADFFVASANSLTDNKEMSNRNYLRAADFYETIKKDFPEENVDHKLLSVYNSLSLNLLRAEEFRDALNAATKGIYLGFDDNHMHSLWALSLLFNDRHDEALAVIKQFGERTGFDISALVLDELLNLKNEGVEHPEHDKIIEMVESLQNEK